MARRTKRAKLITTGRALERADAGKCIVRENAPESGVLSGGEEVSLPIDYERLWRHAREDADAFLSKMLKLQERLCKECLREFQEAVMNEKRRPR